jgi:hypothetical protein
MSNQNNPEPIGDPKPMSAKQWRSILKRAGGIVAVCTGGLVAFACFITPTRLQGATRSARLKWQQRDAEIQQAIDAQSSSGKTAKDNGAEAQPPISPGT